MLLKVKKYAFINKTISVIISAIVILGGYYSYGYFFGATTETRYIMAVAEKMTLISSVSGSGQVSAYNQLDIKPKASGDIIWINMKVGQSVYAGQALASLDSSDAKKALATAELDLAETKLSFDKAVAEAPINYDKKIEALARNKDNLEKAYEGSFNNISNAFLELPTVMTGLDKILYGYEFNPIGKEWNVTAFKNLYDGADRNLIISLADIAEKDYKIARTAYDKNFANFKNLTRYSDRVEIEKSLSETLETTKAIAQAAKSENNLLDTVIDIAEKKDITVSSVINALKTNLRSYLGTVNSRLSSLLDQNSALVSAGQSIIDTEREISILKINNPTGINPIDLQIFKNNINKKEVSLEDLRNEIANYTIRAPFSGIIAKVNSRSGDTVSAGTTVGSLITKQKIAEISLNEVDVAKVKLGQKATLTFDAVEDFSLTGEVAEIEAIGSVSQGVVSYNIKITFDADDDRVKPGMSTSASIITEIRQDVLAVPNNAIKNKVDYDYVEVAAEKISIATPLSSQGIMLASSPVERVIETGISNDTHTEIISGLKEGDIVVVRTTTNTAKTTTNTARATTINTNSIRLPGLGGGR
jgi:HlyD family secretion protein